MISNKANDSATVVALLHASPIEFHMSGSRFFGGHTEGSDWDFFTKDTPETRGFLEFSGFEKLRRKYYGGNHIKNNANAVYRLGKVDVQLIDDPELKLKAQDILQSSPAIIKNFLNNKVSAKELWDWVYTILER